MSVTERPPDGPDSECELCTHEGGQVLWRDERCRVVLVSDPDYAGYCRIIWRAHVKEMTDLSPVEREHCMRVVFAVERAVRETLNPHKINLASFGNMTPHLHWHVIPRELTDAHFPNPVWGERKRATDKAGSEEIRRRAGERLAAAMAKLL